MGSRCIQFLDGENSDKNNTLPLGKQICFTKVWGCVEIFTKKIFKDKSAANFLVKFVSKTQHMHLDR